MRKIRAKKTFDLLHAPARVTGKHFVSLVGVDEQQIVTKDCFICDGTAETRDFKRNAAKQHSMIPPLYLNNVFGDISPHLHGMVSVLGALGASRTLFCFVLREGRRLECKTLL